MVEARAQEGVLDAVQDLNDQLQAQLDATLSAQTTSQELFNATLVAQLQAQTEVTARREQEAQEMAGVSAAAAAAEMAIASLAERTAEATAAHVVAMEAQAQVAEQAEAALLTQVRCLGLSALWVFWVMSTGRMASVMCGERRNDRGLQGPRSVPTYDLAEMGFGPVRLQLFYCARPGANVRVPPPTCIHRSGDWANH